MSSDQSEYSDRWPQEPTNSSVTRDRSSPLFPSGAIRRSHGENKFEVAMPISVVRRHLGTLGGGGVIVLDLRGAGYSSSTSQALFSFILEGTACIRTYTYTYVYIYTATVVLNRATSNLLPFGLQSSWLKFGG